VVEEARRKGEERGRRRVELMVVEVVDGVVEVEKPGRRRPADSFCSEGEECGLTLLGSRPGSSVGEYGK